MQGFENFKKEFEQLRRAFRFDEFETVTNASPPTNPVTKASSAALTQADRRCPCGLHRRFVTCNMEA